MANHPIAVPDPSRQIAFHQLLVSARKTWLLDALTDALDRIDPDQLSDQLVEYVPKDARRILAKAAIRDEHVFPIPTILETAPTLVRQLSPMVTRRDVQELPLLTLGSFFQGANNVLIGKKATEGVFLSIKAIVEENLVEHHFSL